MVLRYDPTKLRRRNLDATVKIDAESRLDPPTWPYKRPSLRSPQPGWAKHPHGSARTSHLKSPFWGTDIVGKRENRRRCGMFLACGGQRVYSTAHFVNACDHLANGWRNACQVIAYVALPRAHAMLHCLNPTRAGRLPQACQAQHQKEDERRPAVAAGDRIGTDGPTSIA